MAVHPQQSFLSLFPQPPNQPPRPPYLSYLQHSHPFKIVLFHGFFKKLSTLND
ncbi:hypothetical protein Gohar_005337 [Gossypium harknessii]|uniref:Uncharacterized protein n=1 Tax=Gossypium harknessii TaxID=34285 RepID=A0A7J9H896_9ROSI|nr:hypothetical protein [Gossypium harknessii]